MNINTNTGTKLYVVRDTNTGLFLALDEHSGGYPYWQDRPVRAEMLKADLQGVQTIDSNVVTESVTVHELILGPAMSRMDFYELSREEIYANALTKLSPVERKVLGV